METIRQLVRNLALLVILAAFLEMLLPLQGTRRFVQVIIGLFIMLTVLGPIVMLFRQQPPLHFDLPANSGNSGEDLNKILEQGQSLQEVTPIRNSCLRPTPGGPDRGHVQARPGRQGGQATVLLSPDNSLKSLGTVQKVTVQFNPVGNRRRAGRSPTRCRRPWPACLDCKRNRLPSIS